MPEKPIRLRDVVKFRECYFSVVSYFNDPVKCLLRYVPENLYRKVLKRKPEAEKVRGSYVKLDHDEALNFFMEHVKDGIFLLPPGDVEVFKPEILTPKLVERDNVLRKVYDLFSVPEGFKGVTGSRLIGLSSESSDVDFVVYGEWFEKARKELKEGLIRGKVEELEEDEWRKIYRKRRPAIDFDTFVTHEKRKYHRGFVGETYFDLLYVRDYSNLTIFSEFRGVKVGKILVEGLVENDSAVFDYPARYPMEEVKVLEFEPFELGTSDTSLEKVRITEVLSFTHTYVGQAFRGERIRAYGVLEVLEVDGKFVGKVIVGTRRVSDEYIVSMSLIE